MIALTHRTRAEDTPLQQVNSSPTTAPAATWCHALRLLSLLLLLPFCIYVSPKSHT
jgi:hypothetical protein